MAKYEHSITYEGTYWYKDGDHPAVIPFPIAVAEQLLNWSYEPHEKYADEQLGWIYNPMGQGSFGSQAVEPGNFVVDGEDGVYVLRNIKGSLHYVAPSNGSTVVKAVPLLQNLLDYHKEFINSDNPDWTSAYLDSWAAEISELTRQSWAKLTPYMRVSIAIAAEDRIDNDDRLEHEVSGS